MRFAVDWFSTILFLSVYAFSRIPGVPPRVGNLALAAACGVIVGYRFKNGGLVGPNAIFVGIAAALGIYFLTRAFGGGGGRGPRSAPGDD
jgi:hypothetical protein